MRIHHINLQPAIGGGEVYTKWFTRAMADAGAKVTLYVDPSNRFWDGLGSDNVEIVRARDPFVIAKRLPAHGAVLMTQSRLPEALADLAAKSHVLTGFAHMPMLDRSAAEFARYSTVFTVSNYCIGLLRQAGIAQVYPEPLYGAYDLDRETTPILEHSPFHWDRHKGRDRILSMVEPIVRSMRARRLFSRREGLTLGIVSLLSPIKQFPLLFSLLAPKLARLPGINLEIFGNGGYAQVRDLRKALAPMIDQVRFWGYQQAVGAVYAELDYLMTGLPEKEALGLNVLESQAAGTPVLAPRAPPFTETIVHGEGGLLYRDPREDGGIEFGDLIASIRAGRPRPDPRAAAVHLEKFSYAAMVRRARGVLEHLRRAQANYRQPSDARA
ncbi:MAG: glycosyltransferase family 4 protein [Betaproteobacteria bacterium]|nr:glycosyltransferase family 4 protein [Betaproteobacteria bacterium]